MAEQWEKYFISIKQVSREDKLREFHFTFVHRNVVTEEELSRFGIQDHSECLNRGGKESIEQTFSDCFLIKAKKFLSKVVQWYNCNQSPFKSSNQECLFGILSNPVGEELLKKINYTLIFARYFICTNNLKNNSLLIINFVSKISLQNKLENLD